MCVQCQGVSAAGHDKYILYSPKGCGMSSRSYLLHRVPFCPLWTLQSSIQWSCILAYAHTQKLAPSFHPLTISQHNSCFTLSVSTTSTSPFSYNPEYLVPTVWAKPFYKLSLTYQLWQFVALVLTLVVCSKIVSLLQSAAFRMSHVVIPSFCSA